MARGVCYRYFNNNKATEMYQVILAFTIGILFSPWNNGLILFIIFIIAYEILYFYATGFQTPYWRLEGRLAIFMASILGFIIGRTLVGFDDPIADKKPKLTRQLAQFKVDLSRLDEDFKTRML